MIWVRVARLTDDEMADLSDSGLVFAEENADEGATDVLVMVE